MIRIPLNLLLSPILATAILFTGAGKVRAGELLVVAAARAGGGFVDYFWDNPAIEGPDQSPKISYAAPVEILGASYYIGAGLYPPPEETDVAPSSWGELKRRI